MRTIDVSIEDAYFAELDAVSRAVGLTPAEFARSATASAVKLNKARDAARRDIAGYEAKPLSAEEFAIDPDDLASAL